MGKSTWRTSGGERGYGSCGGSSESEDFFDEDEVSTTRNPRENPINQCLITIPWIRVINYKQFFEQGRSLKIGRRI